MCKDYQKDFDAGLYTKVRPDRFDSVSEKKVCLILNRILKDYGLEKMMQKRLDAYKNGVASNIGAQMIRIRYEDLKPENEEQLRELYEETIVMGIIKGLFTRNVNFRKSGDLITGKNQKHFDYLVDRYKKALQADGENMFYQKMLQWLYTSKELGAVSAN